MATSKKSDFQRFKETALRDPDIRTAYEAEKRRKQPVKARRVSKNSKSK